MSPEGTPDSPGAYQLHLRLPRCVRIKVGKLGTFQFPRGSYVYTGSALGGLRPRLARHQRRSKRLHWHIDYLLRHAKIADIVCYPTTRKVECDLNREILDFPDAQVVVKRFGSSDCRCPSHLVYLGEDPAAVRTGKAGLT